MPNFTYTRDLPDAPHNPSTDQPDMKINTNSTDSIIEVDHYSFNDNNGGYHKTIHQLAGSDPAIIAGLNQTYAKNYTPDTSGGVADTQLFTRTSLGVISQLTGYSLGDLEDGWQWIGGMLLQWGRAGSGTVTSGSFAGGNAAGTVFFIDRVTGAIPFPNNCFIVLTVPHYATTVPSSEGTVGIDRPTLSKTKFNYRFNSNSDKYNGFYWVAIGN